MTETREQASAEWAEQISTQPKSSRCSSEEVAAWVAWEVREVREEWEAEAVRVVDLKATASGLADCFMLLAHIVTFIDKS